MSTLFAVHSDWDELSKISHILGGRDFILHKFNETESALAALEKNQPDACLLTIDAFEESNRKLMGVLEEKVSDCPIILLANKTEIPKAIEMVGTSVVYDYFLLSPIVDPARLHVIIDKALVYSAVQLNLKSLKQRLASIPQNVPESVGGYSKNLSGEIGKVLDNFKEQMKSHEFKQIVKLLDEKAFEEKLQEMHEKQIVEVLQKGEQKIKEHLTEKLTSATSALQNQVDNPPSLVDLRELRAKLASGFYFDSSELLEHNVTRRAGSKVTASESSERIAIGETATTVKVLVMQDTQYPAPELLEVIREMGYELLEAHSRRKFVHMSRNNSVNVLIIGLNTGEVDGIEILKEIHSSVNARIPAILLTVNPSSEVIRRAREAGFEKILKIPFQRSAIQKVIKECLSEKTSVAV
jgi:response regulator RpfG family c-di-GMP phosphodiesterase